MCVPMYSAAGQRGHPKARVFNNKFFGYGSKKKRMRGDREKERQRKGYSAKSRKDLKGN